MNTTAVVDTNIIIRFFLNDDPHLSARAREFFETAQINNTTIYIDELIIAEVIWLMLSFYKKKQVIINLLMKLLSQKWVVNPRKKLVLETLAFYNSHNVSFIDSWTLMVARNKHLPLITFDKTLDKLAKSP